jgi:RNA polymerase sigma-70 factor (ECF subfamily)
VNEPSDILLMQRIAAKDAPALKALYGRYGRVAFALAYRVIGEAAGAEEVVQDAFETVWAKSYSFDVNRGGNVRGWLLTIVHRRAIDYRRRELDRPPRNLPLETTEHLLTAPDVWQDVSATLLGEQVRAALDALPPEQRRAVELSFFEGLSHGEIAEREQQPLGTVKGRMRLGLRKLSTLLASPDDTPISALDET